MSDYKKRTEWVESNIVESVAWVELKHENPWKINF